MQTIPLDIHGDSAIPMTIDESGTEIPLSVTSPGGTNDYNSLINKPSINAVELIGDKNFTDLHLENITPQQIDEIMYGGN